MAACKFLVPSWRDGASRPEQKPLSYPAVSRAVLCVSTDAHTDISLTLSTLMKKYDEEEERGDKCRLTAKLMFHLQL